MKVAFNTLRRGAVLLALVILGGCEGLFGNDAQVYTLATVNGQAVPAPSEDIIQWVEAEITLHDDTRATMTGEVRCNPNPPPGTGCEITIPRNTSEGTYSRSEGWLRFGTAEYEARFEDRKVVLITDSCLNPVYCSTMYVTVLEFRR